MANKMLIDAAHPEETRVVVLRGNRVEEFDFESASKKQLKGNIYLAKVTRVEPALQACFVEYGGNRHGFLAFSEIHPDYYQIPVADRKRILAEEQARERARVTREDAAADRAARGGVPTAIEDAGGDDAGGEDWESEADQGQAASAQPLTADQPVRVGALPEVEREAPEVAAEIASEDLAPWDEGVENTVARRAEPQLLATETDDDAGEDEAGAVAHGGEIAEAPHERTAVAPASARGPANDDDGDDGDDEDGDDGFVETSTSQTVEQIGSEDALEELPERPRMHPRRTYKIQEVIRRRQILLIQVVKEERGNKGAALTTYLSLAGRYTVLMPNTARGGGISRKITNAQDRKRLRTVADDLEVPDGMGLIIRTAGAARTEPEIKRDYEYLLRLWESVRDLTLSSSAPALVYEEGNLIKRSIRDLYSKDIDDVTVAGEAAYREAKDFMRMLMPSHAKNVQLYKEPEPIFSRFGIERQLAAMFNPEVHLPSGGYIVINQTEALVAIDVNSGKSTREHNIEDTALKTNLEAAEEVARQLRLRDLAGLVVIDFIDMEEKRNNRAVEKRLKDSLKNDRARIQVGRISHFGLLEMSRQRLRTGMLEGSTHKCSHCHGTGIVRSTESMALTVLRALEDALMRSNRYNLAAVASTEVALYILNHKREFIADLEVRYGVRIEILADSDVHGSNYRIQQLDPAEPRPQAKPATAISAGGRAAAIAEDEADLAETDEADGDEAEGDEGSSAAAPAAGSAEDAERRSRRRRRRRRGRGRQGEGQGAPVALGSEPYGAEPGDADADGDEGDGDDDDQPITEAAGDQPDRMAEAARDSTSDSEAEGDDEIADATGEGEDDRGARRPRRRGRRGGRRHRNGEGSEGLSAEAVEAAPVHGRGAPAVDLAKAEQPPAPYMRSAPESRGVPPQPADDTNFSYSAGWWSSGSAQLPAQPAEAAPVAVESAAETAATMEGEQPIRPADAAPASADKAPEAQPAKPVVADTRSPLEKAQAAAAAIAAADAAASAASASDAEPDPSKPTRRGWWQRRLNPTG